MQTEPLLSVIVPVYNSSQYLRRCIDSLMNQTYENLEIILVDDGSKDDSPGICDEYARLDMRIRVIHKQNAGLGYARNSGLDMSTGAYVTFLDSDDFVDEKMYSSMMDELLREKAQAAFCDFCYVRRDGSKIRGKSGIVPGKHTAQQIMQSMMGAEPEAKRDFDFDMSVCKAVYAMEVIEKYAIRFLSEREVTSEDIFFNLKFLGNSNHVVYIDRCFYYYCENAGSLTHRYHPNWLEKEKELFRLLLPYAQQLQSEYRLKRLFLGRIRAAMGQYARYAEVLPFAERIRGLRKMAADEQVRAVICNYPLHKNPTKIRIFNMFLKWNFSLGMYFLLSMNR